MIRNLVDLNWLLKLVLLIFGIILVISVVFHFPGVIELHVGSDGGSLMIDGRAS